MTFKKRIKERNLDPEKEKGVENINKIIIHNKILQRKNNISHKLRKKITSLSILLILKSLRIRIKLLLRI